ncbi:MAG: hypothetical protein ACK56I_13120, partial [bacterium]
MTGRQRIAWPRYRPSACPGPKLPFPPRGDPAPVAGRTAGRVGEPGDADVAGRVDLADDSWPAGRTALGDRRVWVVDGAAVVSS